ncbi:hypothetical protein [Aquimarina sp. AU58]|uniref:hypothetical protein n=1 Tax=Aquimarina sp. AU58 TaxID=1874112 RepID=UPI000D6E6C29|nr:hypothetical protein [Aquimarina sp. AU58]
MPFPEVISIPQKSNAVAFTDPITQFSADELNQIVEKHNKNALFHGVHPNYNALIVAHPNPKIGASALLIDGTEYRSTTGVWITKDIATEQDNKTIQNRMILVNPLTNINEYAVIADQINNLPNFVVQEDETALFYIYQGSIEKGIYRIDYEIVKGKGTYGQSGTALQAQDINKTALKFIKKDAINGFQDLGDIGVQTIEDYINANGPYGIQGDRFFQATISGIENVYLYTGNAGVIGTGNTQTIATDYNDIYTTSINAVLINIREIGVFASTNYVDQGDANVLNTVTGRIGTWTVIDGYRVDKKTNPDYNAIEIGDEIHGKRSATRFIVADVTGMPYTDDANLEFYIDTEK